MTHHRPEQIGRTLSPRAARMYRAAERWAELRGELRGVPLEVVQRAVAARADERARDLDAEEVDSVARAAVDEHEQAEAERAFASARSEAADQEREAYLRRAADRYRLTADATERR